MIRRDSFYIENGGFELSINKWQNELSEKSKRHILQLLVPLQPQLSQFSQVVGYQKVLPRRKKIQQFNRSIHSHNNASRFWKEWIRNMLRSSRISHTFISSSSQKPSNSALWSEWNNIILQKHWYENKWKYRHRAKNIHTQRVLSAREQPQLGRPFVPSSQFHTSFAYFPVILPEFKWCTVISVRNLT